MSSWKYTVCFDARIVIMGQLKLQSSYKGWKIGAVTDFRGIATSYGKECRYMEVLITEIVVSIFQICLYMNQQCLPFLMLDNLSTTVPISSSSTDQKSSVLIFLSLFHILKVILKTYLIFLRNFILSHSFLL